MKLIPAVSILASIASADILTLVKTLQAQIKNNGSQFRNFDHIWDGLGGILDTMTEKITSSGDYGCWCYFASNNGYVGSGYGQPVDAYDRACKTLHDNYACMQIDDSTCDPFTVSYTVPDNWMVSLSSTSEFATTCNAENPNDACAANACISESAFVKVYLEESVGLNSDYQHTSLSFDPATACNLANSFTSWSANRGDKACCGEYPNRQIFYNGNKECCGGVYVYNTVTKECCSNDVIKNAGDCGQYTITPPPPSTEDVAQALADAGVDNTGKPVHVTLVWQGANSCDFDLAVVDPNGSVTSYQGGSGNLDVDQRGTKEINIENISYTTAPAGTYTIQLWSYGCDAQDATFFWTAGTLSDSFTYAAGPSGKPDVGSFIYTLSNSE